jgi:hypothetical protein
VNDLSLDQRRQLIDATQAFEAWRTASKDFEHAYRGTMRWQRSKGKDYLVRQYNRVIEGLGPRSAETEAVKAAYSDARTRLRQRISRLDRRMKDMAPVNRALRLGRMPTVAANILRKLDASGLLGRALFVVGTHALFAYEVRCGVLLEGGLVATSDVDLLVDTRSRLSFLVTKEIQTRGIIGLLQQVDTSFKRTQDFRAVNDQGYYVDIVAPLLSARSKKSAVKLSERNDDLAAAELIGLEWLVNAPRFDAVAIAEDGMPVWIPCIDPRAFALHKFWVSQRPERDPLKRRRDQAQALAVFRMVTEYLQLSFRAKDLSALPLPLIEASTTLREASRSTRE